MPPRRLSGMVYGVWCMVSEVVYDFFDNNNNKMHNIICKMIVMSISYIFTIHVIAGDCIPQVTSLKTCR
jgi:hypothetical protein